MVAPAGGAAAAGLLLRTHTERHLSERAAVAVTDTLCPESSVVARVANRAAAAAAAANEHAILCQQQQQHGHHDQQQWWRFHEMVRRTPPGLARPDQNGHGMLPVECGRRGGAGGAALRRRGGCCCAQHPLKYDWARTGRAALFGFAMHAPLSHLHFNFLEWMTVKLGLQGLAIPVFKTVMVRCG